MKVDIKNWDNKTVGNVELSDAIFGLEARPDILARVVNWQRSKAQRGTHKTKTISEISGTTKKPFKQKGTGNARQGSLRSAHMRGGQTTFGPVVRSHAYSLPKKIRALGLKVALSVKQAEGKLIVIEDAKLSAVKTKNLSKSLSGVVAKKALIVDGNELDENFKKAVRNIKNIKLLPTVGANVLDILRHDQLLITKEGIKQLEQRLGAK